jgi:hypothetical protein
MAHYKLTLKENIRRLAAFLSFSFATLLLFAIVIIGIWLLFHA